MSIAGAYLPETGAAKGAQLRSIPGHPLRVRVVAVAPRAIVAITAGRRQRVRRRHSRYAQALHSSRALLSVVLSKTDGTCGCHAEG